MGRADSEQAAIFFDNFFDKNGVGARLFFGHLLGAFLRSK
jgi:hypothetical protein